MLHQQDNSFLCGVCGCPYSEPQAAAECERQTKPQAKFNIGEKATYRTVAVEFETRIHSRTLAFTRIGEAKIATHTWFYEIDYPKMGTILTPEALLFP